MLPDPRGSRTRFLNRSLQPLAATEAYRARILLAESGMGKTHELDAEVDRLRQRGHYVAKINLGEYGDGTDLREEFGRTRSKWEHSGSEELVLALDSFDQPLFDIAAVARMISRCLETIDSSRLRLLSASRSSLWDTSLEATFEGWWGTD